MTNLSEHFTLEEAVTTSHREINNSVTLPTLITTLSRCAVKLEKVRALIGLPLHINSWYRCLALNRAIGSKDTSDHLKGQAVDFICPQFGTPLEICKKLILNKEVIGFKQLILEHTWVHISWDLEIPGTIPKCQVLSLTTGGNYAEGLTDINGVSLA